MCRHRIIHKIVAQCPGYVPHVSLVTGAELHSQLTHGMALQGYDQRVIDLFLDVFRGEMEVEGAGEAGQILISPFSSLQPAARQLRNHTPARFSKEVVRSIRHAAARAFQVCFPCRQACPPIRTSIWTPK